MPFLQMVKFHLKAISQDDQINPGKTSLTLVPLLIIPPTPAPIPTPAPVAGRATLQSVNGVVSRIDGSAQGKLKAYPGYNAGQPIPFLINNADAAGLIVGMEFTLTSISPAPSA